MCEAAGVASERLWAGGWLWQGDGEGWGCGEGVLSKEEFEARRARLLMARGQQTRKAIRLTRPGDGAGGSGGGGEAMGQEEDEGEEEDEWSRLVQGLSVRSDVAGMQQQQKAAAGGAAGRAVVRVEPCPAAARLHAVVRQGGQGGPVVVETEMLGNGLVDLTGQLPPDGDYVLELCTAKARPRLVLASVSMTVQHGALLRPALVQLPQAREVALQFLHMVRQAGRPLHRRDPEL